MLKQLITFGIRHWFLVLATFFTFVLIILENIKHKLAGIAQLTPQEGVLLLNQNTAVVIDLRTAQAFSEQHIFQAINLPDRQLIVTAPALKNIKRAYTLILIADNDQELLAAATPLKSLGFTKLATITGGLAAWRAAHFPVEGN